MTNATPDLDNVPTIVVECTNPSCAQYDVEQTTPAGILLADGVLLTGTLGCTVCGMQLYPLAGTRDAIVPETATEPVSDEAIPTADPVGDDE